jgi:23S rRNA pseudouridine2605 synthase
MPTERLQKIIAAAGIASRRKAEELITSGLVSVNGQIVTQLGSKADIEHDHIKVNGKLLKGPERPVYLLLNKPKGYVTTVTDPEGRPTVLDLVRGVGARIYPVGRLDYLSEGLLLLTNDGELAQKLMHASSHVAKTYLVKIAGKATEEQIDKLRAGIMLPAERKSLKTAADRVPKVG